MLGVGEHVLGEAVPQIVELAAFDDPVVSDLAHRLQHREAIVVAPNPTELAESEEVT
jgi:hypothetical protein